MARTAVIAGTATAVSGSVQARQQSRAQAQQFESAPPPPAVPDTTDDDLLTQLAKLGQMNQAGLIDDAEFAAAKAKLLGN
jgi:hypothetical protein